MYGPREHALVDVAVLTCFAVLHQLRNITASQLPSIRFSKDLESKDSLPCTVLSFMTEQNVR